jgi:hypothetical protein
MRLKSNIYVYKVTQPLQGTSLHLSLPLEADPGLLRYQIYSGYYFLPVALEICLILTVSTGYDNSSYCAEQEPER